MKHHAVFFDRDGTINIDPGYLGNPDLVELFPGVSKSISELKINFGFKIVVVSNQSGISRGLITRENVDTVNKRINELLEKDGGKIDAFYYCPYHPDIDPLNKCTCRKPSPEMLLKAADDLNIDLSKSYMVGDMKKDIECGMNAGVKTILVKNKLNNDQIIMLHDEKKSPNFIAENFKDACKFICDDFSGGFS